MSESAVNRLYWAGALAIFLIALATRATIFQYGIDEGDELIYKALVEQLFHGHGYTLHGHPLIANDWIAKTQYDAPMFYHPPLAIYFFYGVAKAVGMRLWGLQLAQILSFALFYSCGLYLTQAYVPKLSASAKVLVAAVLAFLPIYAHANMKVWIDNPRVAFFTLHWALVTAAFQKKAWWLYGAAALTALLATLCKIDGLLALPFAYAMAYTLVPKAGKGRALFFLSALLAANFAAAGLWLYVSEALKYGSGRPSAELLALNPFIRLVTVEMSSWQFLVDYFKEEATILPSFFMLLFCQLGKQKEKKAKQRLFTIGPRLILALWIMSHCAVYAILGCFGFSKVLRYIVMTTPAEALLFALALSDGAQIFQERKRWNQKRRWIFYSLSALMAAAVVMEITQGGTAVLLYARTPWLRPLY
jgi:hypothetical protein